MWFVSDFCLVGVVNFHVDTLTSLEDFTAHVLKLLHKVSKMNFGKLS